jgi:CheY-like chemotaxis protein
MLRDHHDVTVLTDGREALSMVAAGSAYDLIFCDLMMPNLSGVEVYDLMAATNATQASRIVFMTGGAFTGASQDFLDRIGAVHITKPFTAETIREIAAAWVAPT